LTNRTITGLLVDVNPVWHAKRRREHTNLI